MSQRDRVGEQVRCWGCVADNSNLGDDEFVASVLDASEVLL
jgi:hypothetical protein